VLFRSGEEEEEEDIMNIKYIMTFTIVAFFIICGLCIFSIAQAI
jgi:hypothetical protein